MDRTGQSRGVLRIVSVSLSFLLAFGMMAALPTAAYADEEYVCMIGDVGYTTIDVAIGRAQENDIIRLLTDTNSLSGIELEETTADGAASWSYAAISINGKTLTIDTNGFTLNIGKIVVWDGEGNIVDLPLFCDYGLRVSGGGELILADSSAQQTGQLIVSARYAVYATGSGSKVTVTSATGFTAGVLAVGGAEVTINGTLAADEYILLGSKKDKTVSYPKDSGVISTSKPGYYEYSDGSNCVYTASDGSIKTDVGAGLPRSGDLDGDGYVTLTEALVVARVVVCSVNLTAEQFAAVDMDADGYITMADVLLVMRKACGL